ncbi:MAG: DNA-directed RNA polymerase [Candidatus Altiarchaeales archaeon WOR_SM1_79]|nr:MAG: DNA-directed RNA polymerase [Candidatus Altiarchaeales archaeon WOR_SM1_79]
MYKILTVEDTVRVPPRRFNEDLETAIISEFENIVAGKVDKNIGIILSVTKVREMGEGKIIMGDGAIYYDVKFDILVYQPVLNEVVEGTVTEIIEFGAFINFGPMDGLAHVSQVTEDYMNYDQKNAMLVGKESNKTLKQGDTVRARIVSVSLKPKFANSKIGLTMRQPYLGKLEWLEEEKKAQKVKEEKAKTTKKK